MLKASSRTSTPMNVWCFTRSGGREGRAELSLPNERVLALPYLPYTLLKFPFRISEPPAQKPETPAQPL